MVKNKKKKIENESDDKVSQKTYNWQSDSDHGYDADCFQKKCSCKYKCMDNKINVSLL